MTAQLVTDALVMAIWRRGKPDALLHHPIVAAKADSSGRRNTCLNFAERLVKRLGRGSPPQRLAWPGIERRDTASSSWTVWALRSVPFGKYCRSRPLVFSLVPRCHGLCGSQN